MKHQFCFILKISYLAAHKSEVYMFWGINIEKLKRDDYFHGECVCNAYSKELSFRSYCHTSIYRMSLNVLRTK